MEDMRAELDNMLQLASYRGRFLPPGGITDRMIPAIRGEFRVDVRDHDDEIIVVADLPGVEKDDVSLQILNPRTLEISCERKGENEEKSEDYYVRERVYGSMQRLVILPGDVTEKDAKASFKNGVLEVRLNKTKISPKSRIEIE
jgi:HSP20 family protein